MKGLFKILLVLTLSLCINRAEAQVTGIKIVGDTCAGFTLDIQILGTSSSPYFFWNFGDPASGVNDTVTITGLSSPPFPTHTFTGPGVYTICVTFQEPGFPPQTICRTQSIGLCCNGIIAATDSCLENGTTFSLLTGEVINTINWNFNDPASGTNNTSAQINPTHTFSAAGSYTVTATVTAACGTFTATYPVSIISCQPPPPCVGSITFADTCLANGTTFQINGTSPIAIVSWNFGDTASGLANTSTLTNPTHTFSDTGSYTVQAMIMFECGPDTITQNITIGNCFVPQQPDCPLYIPNAFRPNADGQNDGFSPSTFCTPESYTLAIYNRWGSLLFESNNLLDKWDGKYKGKPCQPGVYVYTVHCKFIQQPEKKYRGSVTLLR